MLAGIADIHFRLLQLVQSECCSSFSVQGSTPQPHHSSSCKPPMATSSQEGGIQDHSTGVEMPTWWSPKVLGGRLFRWLWQTEGRQWPSYLIVPRIRTSVVQRAFAVFGPWTWMDLHLCDEHNITNVSAQIDNVPVTAVTVVVLWQQRLVLHWLSQWAQHHINVTLSLLTLDSFIAPTPGRITTELSRPASRAHLSIGVGR